MTSGDDPAENLKTTRAMLAESAAGGADLVLTPEVTNCVSTSRARQMSVLALEDEDQTLRSLRDDAAQLGVWLCIGSLALRTDDVDGRFANLSFVITPTGQIAARYDKIHMFDVEVTPDETYRESDGYRPGARAVVCPSPLGALGLSICYDVRFAHLYRALAQAGAEILLVPAAFSPVTGAAHWEPLLRARAIETGCYVFACAQTGTHPAQTGRARQTYGHSVAIAPWGEVLLDAGTAPGVSFIDFDLSEVSKARRRVPSLRHDRPFEDPTDVGRA